ncbi:MAG TPA: EAL domain-containing protein [Thermoanaerobaculia bacterium]|jgi:diguanylate cyclase (GGDEF)-like protein/PAS domain S-box-containing protein
MKLFAPTDRLSRWSSLIMLCLGVLMTAGIAILSQTALSLLSGVRAYVGGEGLWSKGQKDAVHWIHRYAATGDPKAFASYRAAVAVPLGDRIAREELEKAHPDDRVARAGLLQGRNHPEDVDEMIWLVRNFRWVGYVQSALAIWRQGDAEIARLVSAAGRLDQAIQRAALAEELAPILAEIDAIDARVSPLEDRFSSTLGEAARWARGLALLFIVGAAMLLFVLGALIVRQLYGRVASSEERYRSVTETATDGILAVDERGRVLFANAAAARIFGYPASAITGRSVLELVPVRLRERAGALLRGALLVEQREPGTTHRVYGLHAQGREIPLEVSVGESRDHGRRVVTGIIRDITLRLQAENVIERLAYEDPLTRLPNRALFHDRLRQALAHAQRESEPLALMFLDLDDFKIINDSLGHTFGDGVLSEVARRLVGVLRAEDTAARLGGDELIVLLPRSGEEAAVEQVARKILECIRGPIELQEESVFVTGSIGISLYPQDGADPETLLRNADIAMYRAKEQGGNTFEFFRAQMDERLSHRYATHRALRLALERGEFSLHYQPVWRTMDSRIVGLEALLRWNHPERGELAPADFIPIAETSPVMVPLGEWVLSAACAQFRAWLDEGLPVEWVSVNLSARQCQQVSLPETVARILGEQRLPAERIRLELTETSATKALETSVHTLAALRAQGIRVLMDDFGTGHASIGALRTLPVDALKIDRHLIERLDVSRADAAMVRAIIEMAHGLGLSVVAEGVSQPSQLEFLRRHGCDEFQGFLLSGAVPPEEIASRLRPVAPPVSVKR